MLKCLQFINYNILNKLINCKYFRNMALYVCVNISLGYLCFIIVLNGLFNCGFMTNCFPIVSAPHIDSLNSFSWSVTLETFKTETDQQIFSPTHHMNCWTDVVCGSSGACVRGSGLTTGTPQDRIGRHLVALLDLCLLVLHESLLIDIHPEPAKWSLNNLD